MKVEDLRRLSAVLTAHEPWLRKDEVVLLGQLRRQVEIGWPLGPRQIQAVEQLHKVAHERSEASA
jgi:hypothetical protein